jgi:Domain of unknown function (DUF4126)
VPQFVEQARGVPEMILTQLLTGFGLAGAAGLNAYIPLLLVSVLGRFGVISLGAPFDILTNWWVIGALSVLLAIEIVVDKIPAVDHLNDILQTFVRPAAGALVFAGGSGAIQNVSPTLLVVAGLFTAFGVHATKAAARPVVNLSTVGVGAPVVSAIEDVFAVVASVAALLFPMLVFVMMLVMAFVAYKTWMLIAKKNQSQSAA